MVTYKTRWVLTLETKVSKKQTYIKRSVELLLILNCQLFYLLLITTLSKFTNLKLVVYLS